MSPATGSLVDQNGVPFLIVGDSPWGLMVSLTDAELDLYFADRRARGFNSILVRIVEHGDFGGPANTNGDPPFNPAGDFSAPVEAYWSRVDAILQRAADEGFLVFLTSLYVGYACGSQGWAVEMQNNSLANHTAYANFLGARYAGFDNIVWVHGGDTDAADCGLDPKVNEIASRLTATTPEKLHTAHCYRQQSALDCYDEPWLTFNSVYSDCSLTSQKVKDAFDDPISMPHFYVEGRYEHESADPECLASQSYWSALGGLEGAFYGNSPIWFFGTGWQSALSDPGAATVEWFARLVKSRKWTDLVPDYGHQHVTAGYGTLGTADYVAVAATSDGDTLIAYAPQATTLTVDMSLRGGTDVNAWTFDAHDGTTALLGVYPTSGTRDFALGNRKVLVLDDASAGFAAPGTEIFFVPEPGAVSSLASGIGLLWILSRRWRRSLAA